MLALAAAPLLWPSAVAAQSDTTWRSLDTLRLTRPARGAPQPPDFLFQQPRASLDLRVGMLFPRVGSGVFQQSMQELTLSRRDFAGLTGALDLGFRVLPRLDALLGIAYSHAAKTSEERDFVEYAANGDTLPIQQQNTFSQLPITAGLKAYLLPRGQQIGHFVWVPARVVPYVGATAGMAHYTFRQSGDFVAYQDSSIFTATYEAHGWTPVAQVLGGVDVRLGRRAAVKAEARYSWAKGSLGRGFVGFNDGLDLAGLQTTLGLSWRY